jgi:hypothetical protein
MTIYPTPFLVEIAAGHSGPPIPAPKRAYFQQRLRNRVFYFILEKFTSAQKEGLTKAILARRIGKTPDLINRWLGAPSNLTLDTVSDILLGISAEELELESSSPFAQKPHNYSHFGELHNWMENSWVERETARASSPPPNSTLNPLGERQLERGNGLGI